MNIGIALAIIGGICACSVNLVDRFSLAKILCLSAGTCLLWFRLWYRCGISGDRLRESFLSVPILVFLGGLIVPVIMSIDPAISILGAYMTPATGAIQLVILGLFAYVLAQSCADRGEDTVIYSLFVALAAVSAYAVVECTTSAGMVFAEFQTQAGDYRASSLIGNPVFCSTTIAALSPVALYMISLGGDKRKAGAFVFVLACVAVCLTRSRGGILAMIASPAVYLFVSGRITKRALIGFVLVFAAILCLFIAQKSKATSDGMRVKVWKLAGRAFLESPIYGHGPETFTLIYRRRIQTDILGQGEAYKQVHHSPHNDLLQAAVSGGLIGLSFYFVAFMVLGGLVWMVAQQHRERGAMIAASLAVLFMVAKINPLSFAELVVGASMAGLAGALHIREFTPDEIKARWTNSLMVLASMLLFVSCGIRVVADFHQLDGIHKANRGEGLAAVYAFNRSTKLVSWEPRYKQRHIKALFPLPGAVVADKKLEVLDAILKGGQEIVTAHPNDADSFHTYAKALICSYLYLNNDALRFAADALDKADDLAPGYPPIVELRKELERRTAGEVG